MTMPEFIRTKLVHLSLLLLKRYGQKELAVVCQTQATEMALDLSVRGVQMILDREGIAHCFHCPQRFGLRVKDGKRLCQNHFSILSKPELVKAS